MDLIIELSPEADAAMARLTAFPAKLYPAVAKGIDLGLELALGQTLARRFTGKGPFPVAEHRLGIVTGRLRASLRRTPAVVSDDGVDAKVGTNLKYFHIHEFGFTGDVQVRAHTRTRHFNAEGKNISALAAKRAKKKKGFTKIEGAVKAHTRRVNVPARAPLFTGLSEQVGILGQQIGAAILRAAATN